MMKLFKELKDLEKELERNIETQRKAIEKEIGEIDKDPKTSVVEAEFPGKTKEHLNVLEFYREKKRKLEEVKNSIEGLETAGIEEEIEDLEEKYAEHSRKDETQLTEAYGTANSCLENAVRLLRDEEYEVTDLWKTGFREYPDEKALNSIEREKENDKFHEVREKHVHSFLTASRYLKTLEFSTKGKSQETREKIGDLEKMREKTSEISQELLKKAETLDFLLLNASAQIREAKNHET